ncbi:MAG TPA: efflux RND transporter periplasmic adaptor subunit [Longimicrobiales bacterium]
MSAHWKWWGLTAAGALAAAAAGCGGSGEAKEPETASPAAAARRVVAVEVEPVVAAPFTDVVSIIGRVAANRDVTISAEEGGVVRSVLADKGAAVRAGQPILKIDDELLAAQVARASADASLARETWERQRRLWEVDGIGTEMAYLQAKYAADRAAADLRLLSERLDRTTIRAPIDGILDARMVEVGTMVAPGTPVVRLVDVATVKVVGGVPERYAPDIREGAKAVIAFDVLGGRAFDGRVGFVAATVDPQDRTVPVEIVVDNPDGVIKPGMVATIAIVRRRLDAAVVVPQEAVLRTEDGYVVYVAAERDGIVVAEARPVVTGASRDDRVVIESGIAPGDRIVVVGQQELAPGDRLQVTERKETAR